MAGFVSYGRWVLIQPRPLRPQLLAGNPTGTVSASVTMTGSGSLTVVATGSYSATVDMTGAGALAVAANLSLLPTVAMAGAGTLTVSSALTKSVTAIMTGGGSLTVTPLVTHLGVVALAGVGTLTVTPGGALQSATVALVGVGALSVTSLVTVPSVVSMGGFGILAIVGGVMASLPAAVTFGTVKAWLGTGVNQAPDADGYADLVAAAGTITFTPVRVLAVYPTASPAPLILAPKPVVTTLDSNGYLVGTKTGEQLVRLIVGSWLVSFQLVGIVVPAFNLAVNAGVTTDLADVIPVA